MTGERTDETGRNDADVGTDADVDGRVVELLRTGDHPRRLASDVAGTLDLVRGRVRTRLQALADAGRVVRTDAEGTARWAVPERADEPEPDEGADRDPDDTLDPNDPSGARPGPDGSAAADTGAGTEGTGKPSGRFADGERRRPPGLPSAPGRTLALAAGLVLALVALRRLYRLYGLRRRT